MTRKSRFVSPGVTRLQLRSQGDWIEVKNRLTTGEHKRTQSSGFKRLAANSASIAEASIEVNFDEFSLARAEAYLVGWGGPGFCDEDGKTVPLSRVAIEELDPETFGEIEQLLNEHVKSQTDATKAAMSDPPTSTSSAPTS